MQTYKFSTLEAAEVFEKKIDALDSLVADSVVEVTEGVFTVGVYYKEPPNLFKEADNIFKESEDTLVNSF
jgi:hypothetical protein